MKTRSKLMLAAGMALIASGCGQKGALYLPGDPSTIQSEIPPQQEPAEEPVTDRETDDDQ